MIPWKESEHVGQTRLSEYLVERGFRKIQGTLDEEVFQRGSFFGNLLSFNMSKVRTRVRVYRKGDFLVAKYSVNSFGQSFSEEDMAFLDLECQEIESVALGNERVPPEIWEDYEESAKGSWLRVLKMIAVPIVIVATISAISGARSGSFEKTPPPGTDSSVHSLSDRPAVYLVPLDGFPEPLAQDLASWLSQDTGLFVKAMPASAMDFAYYNQFRDQYVAESFHHGMEEVSAMLPERTDRTAVIFITDKDIYLESANFRFVFSAHWDERLSLIGTGRYGSVDEKNPQNSEVFMVRTLKLLKRAIGLQYFEYERVSDPDRIMFSPITGIPALDRINLGEW
ncbi:MAG: hypothetical protein AAGJ81_13020 [Verrucomicrobiota bacterium]